MIMRCIKLVCCLLPFTTVVAQEKWDLRRSVEYALQNNISVRQADVQARIVALTYEQSVLSQYPTINMQNSAGYQFGRSIDPSTNQFTTAEILFANHSVNLNLDLFNWFSKKNTVAANRLQAEAYVADAEKARNDVALNVANAYLQILLSAEQIKTVEVQVRQSQAQVNNIRKQVDAGSLPELNLAQVETQLATDSSNLITAQSNYTLSLLQFKALLNIPADHPFEVAIPPVESIPVESLADLDPAVVYTQAIANLPQQKINELNLQSAIKNVAAARGALYPSFVLFGGLDTRYSNAQRVLGKDFSPTIIPIGFVDVGGTSYIVNTQTNLPAGYTKNSYFRQLNNNFSQSIGIGLSVPIMNGGIARTNWKKAKLNVVNAALQKEQGEMTLKQDIYQAHANAVAAMNKYNAARKAVETSQKAYDFATKRAEVGLLNTIDLLISQNNLFSAKISMLSAQYDYVFKMKLLEFYKGQGLKL